MRATATGIWKDEGVVTDHDTPELVPAAALEAAARSYAKITDGFNPTAPSQRQPEPVTNRSSGGR
jgi:hypothetical protein